MKKILSMLAVSTLVATSASNLPQMFKTSVINHDFRSNQLNIKNNTNTFVLVSGWKERYDKVNSLMIDKNNRNFTLIGHKLYKL